MHSSAQSSSRWKTLWPALTPQYVRAWLTACRVAAAVLGGYALTAAMSLLLVRTLPLSRLDALMSVTMLSFALYAAVIIWVISTRSMLRVGTMLLIATLTCDVLAWLVGGASA